MRKEDSFMTSARNKRLILLLSFLLPVLVMAAVFAACGLSPFGTKSGGVHDMAHQYLAFLYYLRYILTGKVSLLYLPSMSLGGNMLGVVGYYLASPLNILTCLFPRERMYEAVNILYLTRVGLCGLTMCIYTGRRHGYSFRCLFPAAAYAMMAYMIGNFFNYEWQDGVIVLPLVALGIARLVSERRPFLYILSLAAALYLNFYIGYALCIFSVLFFLYEILSLPRGENAKPGKTVLLFAVSSLTAGALSAFLLLPVALTLVGGKAEFSPSILTLTPKFDAVRLLSKLYPGAYRYSEISPSGLPNIFCGTATVSLSILYFANRRIPLRRRLLTGALLLVLALSFWITALDLFWHGFNVPTWYDYRYAFLFSFILAAAADRELCSLRDGTRPWHFLLPAALIAAASVAVYAGQTYEYSTWRTAIPAVLIAAAASAALWLALRSGTGRRAAVALSVVILAVHAGELGVSAGISLKHLTAGTIDTTLYSAYVAEKGEALSLIDTGDILTRVESPVFFDQDRCEPMLFNYDGVTHFGSTVSQKSVDFLGRVGVDIYPAWTSYGAGVPAASDSLLGIRWLVAAGPAKDYIQRASTDSYSVLENPNALPVGWTADASFAEDVAYEDSFSYLDGLFAAAAPEVGASIFLPAEITGEVTQNFTADGTHYTRDAEEPANVIYTVTAPADGALYGRLDIPDDVGVMIFANENYISLYANPQGNGTLYLGDYREGEEVTIRVQAFSDIDILQVNFATEDRGALAQYHDAILPGGCELTKLSGSHFAGSFTTAEGDELLVLTLAYDRSWSVTLDGEPVEPQIVQDCVMAIPVTPGSHTVDLRFLPAGLISGAAVSAAAAVLCAAAYILSRRKRKEV